MLGKVVVIAGAGAAAWLLRTQAGQAYARLASRARRGAAGAQEVPVLVDRRPQALEDGSRTAPALLPDPTPAEIALAVSSEHPHPR